MNEDYMDKLVSDIQGYLNEEAQKKIGDRLFFPGAMAESAPKRRIRGPNFSGLIIILSACAIGSLTVAILLLATMGGPVRDPIGIIWLLAAGGCGIFFSAALMSNWNRLIILRQIEKNTRLILATRRKTNALLEEFIQNVR
jgi:hypothetical protein